MRGQGKKNSGLRPKKRKTITSPLGLMLTADWDGLIDYVKRSSVKVMITPAMHITNGLLLRLATFASAR